MCAAKHVHENFRKTKTHKSVSRKYAIPKQQNIVSLFANADRSPHNRKKRKASSKATLDTSALDHVLLCAENERRPPHPDLHSREDSDSLLVNHANSAIPSTSMASLQSRTNQNIGDARLH